MEKCMTLSELWKEILRSESEKESDEGSDAENIVVVRDRVEDASRPDSPGPSAVLPPSPQSPAAADQPPAMSDGSQSPHAKRRARNPESEEGWRGTNDEDEKPHQFPFCPQRTPGVQLDDQRDYSPLDLFQLFFSKEAVEILCQNTNRHVERRRLQGLPTKTWTEVDTDEMFKYLSLVIYLGLLKPAAYRDLWRKHRLHAHPFPSSVMPGYRFEAICAFLHMSDPTEDVVNDQLKGQEGYDALFRLKPLQDQILTACRAYYHPNQNLAIDERMVATRARHSMMQFMKDKPTKWGFKLFVLAESKTGYTCEFSMYQGKSVSPSGNGSGYDAVVNLLRVPFLGTGYRVFVDNFYTSTALFRHLHQIQYGACGTMRENLSCFPKNEVNALPKRASRGDIRWIRRGPLLYVKWKDSRDVCLCSTIHKAYSGQSVQRRLKNPDGTWSGHAVPVPDAVLDYNKYMGGVDLSDALIKYYNVNRKSMRWYMKLFFHFVDIAVVNSHIIHKELALEKGQKPMTQKVFRETLCLQLSDYGKKTTESEGEIARAQSRGMAVPLWKMPASQKMAAAQAWKMPVAQLQEMAVETGPEGCFPVTVVDPTITSVRERATKGRKYCISCHSQKKRNKTIYKCGSCDVPLCIVVDRICFTAWHDLKNHHKAP
ncbi:hypothetical protein SKAU_G00146700 [Synaphobranchus kaupii]|uniref:PiggyBac transposable element-derived protein domain-containing protein n=1 Tax=Synaphobranchus kaupii TaxID=118154 RepID=A0A9Q1J3U1_SYNKA|nr:hypothetical protein SKAU_G00146700 [Synaphobranchus kaupii]